jgi:hypothetical protein
MAPVSADNDDDEEGDNSDSYLDYDNNYDDNLNIKYKK